MSTEPMPRAAVEPAELYVGYLPVPRGHRVFLRRVVPMFAIALLAAGVIASRSQPDPGNGMWDVEMPRTVRGVFSASPYAAILTNDRGDGKPGLVFLVEEGKFGATPRARVLDGQSVEARGFQIHRDGRFMLELLAEKDALAPSNAPEAQVLAPAPPRSLGPVTLRGEIIDPKCFLGAMKPGHGKTHKECATLCITGGIPPMFVTRDRAGAVTYYLLIDASGQPLDRAAYPFIADLVEIRAELEEFAGMLRLRLRPEDIRRL